MLQQVPIDQVNEAVPEELWPSNKVVYVLFLILVGYVSWLCVVLIYLYRGYSGMLAAMQDKPGWTFTAYLHYRFAYWFVWDDNAKLVVLLSVCFTLMVAGTTSYVLALNTTLGHSAYVIFTLLVEPDAGKGERTWEGKVIACVVSISALLIFAVLLAVIQDRFNQMLEQLREGTAAIIECGHYLVVGWTEQALNLIDELCDAYEERGGCNIVILSEVAKPVVEAEIRSRVPLRGSRVVVRCGNVCNRDCLKRVAAHTARTVVILADTAVPLEMRDSTAIRALLTLRAEEWPTSGRMLVQCSRQMGISAVIKQTLGFKGSEFYIQKAPECIVGLNFRQALYHFPLAILAGVLPPASEGTTSSTTAKRFMRRNSLAAFARRLTSAREVSAPTSLASPSPSTTENFLWFPEDHIIGKEDDIVLFADPSEALDAKPEPMVQAAPELLVEVHAEVEDIVLGFNYHTDSSHGFTIFEVEFDSWAERQGLQVGDSISAIGRDRVQGMDENDVFDAFQRRPLSLAVKRTLPTRRRPDCRESSAPKRLAVGSVPLGEKAETILLLGWNESAWCIIADLDNGVLAGTKIVSYSAVPSAERAESLQKSQIYHNTTLQNINVIFADGIIGSRFHMERALNREVLLGTTRIFVLTDSAAAAPLKVGKRDPDAGVITSVLHIRHMLKYAFKSTGLSSTDSSPCIPIVVEVVEEVTQEHCRSLEVLDFVDSAAVASQIISMISYEPRLAGMLQDLVSETATMTMAIRHLSDYPGPLDVKQSMSFLDLVELAQRFGELPLGWSKLNVSLEDGSDSEIGEVQNVALQATVERLWRTNRRLSATHMEWEMNPDDKITRRVWDPNADQLVVLCQRKTGP